MIKRLFLPLILLIAAVLRFQNLGAIEHNIDHAYTIHQALMTLDRGYFPLTGQWTSVLFSNPPLMGYLLIPAVALTRSPLGAYIFILALNTIAVWFVYDAARMIFAGDENRALIAAFLMAVNPWVIEYSRTTWVQALLPFFVPLVFWLLIPILLKTSLHPGRRMIVAGIVITMLTQTYLLAFLILAPVGLLLLIFRSRVPWRSVAVGGVIFGIAVGLYAFGLYQDRADTLLKLNSFTSGDPAYLNPTAWTHAVRLVTGENYAVSRGLTGPIQDWVQREILSEGVHDLILIAILAGIAMAARRVRRDDRALIVLIWFAVPILALSYTAKPVHPFYLLLTLPAGYVLAAWGIGTLLRWQIGRSAIAALATAITVLFGLNVIRFAENTLTLPGVHQMTALPLALGIDTIHKLIPPETRGDEVFIYSGGQGDDLILNSFAGAIFPVSGDSDTRRITHIPAGGGTYIFFRAKDETPPQPPIDATDKLVLTLDDGSTITRFRVLPTDLPTDTPIRSDKGITFLGWRQESPFTPGSTTSILTYWRVDDLAADRDNWLLGPFVHVYDATDHQIANRDTIGVAGADYRRGEIHIERLMIPIPADAVAPFRLEMGQFDGVHHLNALFALPDGTVNSVITFNGVK
jgi:4-amino-4-deoxy-L-arabinose transferase-like glycosyltransferase